MGLRAVGVGDIGLAELAIALANIPAVRQILEDTSRAARALLDPPPKGG